MSVVESMTPNLHADLRIGFEESLTYCQCKVRSSAPNALNTPQFDILAYPRKLYVI